VLNLALVQYTRNSLWVLTSTLKGRKVNYLNSYLPFMVNTYYTEGRNMSRWWPLSHPSTIREIVYRVRIYTLKSRKIKHIKHYKLKRIGRYQFYQPRSLWKYKRLIGWMQSSRSSYIVSGERRQDVHSKKRFIQPNKNSFKISTSRWPKWTIRPPM
jgi:hypothetical protein